MTLAQRIAPPQRTHRWVTLLHLDGREWASAGFTGGSVWEWVVETVAHEHGVAPETVHCLESEDGGDDLVTVSGTPCYRIDRRAPT